MPFGSNYSELKRNIDPVKEYIEQAKHFVSVKMSISLEEAEVLVMKKLNSSKTNNPTVLHTKLNKHGDRVETRTKLREYINDSINDGRTIAPSLTCYFSKEQKPSLHASYVIQNMVERDRHKKLSFVYKLEKNTDLAIKHGTTEKYLKTANNLISGAYNSKSTNLYTPSSHYTLTSTTRCVTSIGNGLTESLVAGNYYFNNEETVLNYVNSLVSNCDVKATRNVMNKYNIVSPSPSELMETIKYSSDLYFTNQEFESGLLDYFSKLNDEQRAYVCYTNSLFNLSIYNSTVIKEMITKLIKKVTNTTSETSVFKDSSKGLQILTCIICAEELQDVNLIIEEADDTLKSLLCSTCNNINLTLDYYRDLIRLFFITEVLPPSIPRVKEMLRDSVVLSSTDSSCGAYDRWVEWYYGKNRFDTEATAVSAVVMTLNTSIMEHYIKVFSKNCNVSEDNKDRLEMKNEFYWPVFVPADISNHYIALMTIREGNVYSTAEPEIKGVHIIAGNRNKEIVDKLQDEFIKVLKKSLVEGKVDLMSFLKTCADVERDMLARIKSGDVSIYESAKIKDKASYKLSEDSSPYSKHTLWNGVYGAKLGFVDEPPYSVKKISTTLDSVEAIEKYAKRKGGTIEAGLMKVLEKRKDLKTIFIPQSIVDGKPIHKDILEIVDVKKVILDNMKPAYILLGMLGFQKSDTTLMELGY